MKTFFFSGCLFLFLSVLGLYAGGSGETKRFAYVENGIGRNVTGEYVGVQQKRMYISGSGASARFICDTAYKSWNGRWGDWERLMNMSYPNGNKNSLLFESTGIGEITVSEIDGKRYIFELILAEGKTEYFWWEGDELHFLQKLYAIK